MAKVTFNGIDKLIVVNTNINELNVGVDIYSEWKRWSQFGDNLKYLPAMTVIGGDPISEITKLGATYFFINGWKLRPYEGNHTLQITGNLYCDDGSVPIINTIGVFNVNVISTVSAIVEREVISSSGGSSVDANTYATACDSIYVDVNSIYNGTTYPVGTMSTPVNNLNDAISICEQNSIHEISFLCDIVINKTFNLFKLNGMGHNIVFNNANFINSSIKNAYISGSILGNVQINQSVISSLTIQSGEFNSCNFIGDVTCSGNYLAIHSSYSSYETATTVSLSAPNAMQCRVDNFIGAIRFINSTYNNSCIINMSSGIAIIDSSCVSGIFNISGICNLINNSDISISRDYIMTPKNISDTLLNYNMNDIQNTGNGLGTYLKTQLLTIFRYIGLK